MKALTVWQPWASLLVTPSAQGSTIAHKEYETRGWATKYRGPLVIHAAARKMDPNDFFGDENFLGIPAPKVYGALLGIVDLIDCIPSKIVIDDLTATEWALGDYSPGRFAWKTRILRTFAEPIPYKGAQGLWSVPDSVLEVAA